MQDYIFVYHSQFEEKDSFKIEDPFDKNYNPAKPVKRYSDLENEYF
jgi:hypothetical protein